MRLLPRSKAEGGRPAVDVIDALEGNAHTGDLLLGKLGIADAPDGMRIRIDDEAHARLADGGKLFVGKVLLFGAALQICTVIAARFGDLNGIGKA